MRAFVKLRQVLSTRKELAHRFKELEGRIEKHDKEIYTIFGAIRQLLVPLKKNRPKTGFKRDED